MIKIVNAFLLCLFVSCSSTSVSDFSSSKHKNEGPSVIGQVNVFINGTKEDLKVTSSGICKLYIDNEGKEIRFNLKKLGRFYLNANSGSFSIKKIECSSLVYGDQAYEFKLPLPKTTLKEGKINYIGDILINWTLGSEKKNWKEMLPYGKTGFKKFGPLDIQVLSNSKTLDRFVRYYPTMKDIDIISTFIKL